MFKGRLPFGSTGKDSIRRLRGDGDAAMVLRNWPDAIRNYKDYVAACPDDGPIWVQLGHALKESGHREEAVDAYRGALRARPGDADAMVHLTDLLKNLGQVEEQPAASLPSSPAVISVSSAVPETLRVAEAEITHLVQGDRSRDIKDWRNAALFYGEHLTSHPNDAAIWVQLGHMLKEHGDREDAVEAYRIARRLESEPSDVSIHLAALLTLMGRPGDAEPLWADMFRKNGSFFLPTN